MVINHVSKSWDDPPSGKVQDKLLRAGGFAVEGAKRAAPLLSLPWALGVRAVVPWLKSWVTFASGKWIETKAGLSAFIDLIFFEDDLTCGKRLSVIVRLYIGIYHVHICIISYIHIH